MKKIFFYILLNMQAAVCFSQKSIEVDLYEIHDSALLSVIERHSHTDGQYYGLHVLDMDKATDSITIKYYSLESTVATVTPCGAAIMNGHIYILPQQICQQDQWSISGYLGDYFKVVLHDKAFISKDQMRINGLLTYIPVFYTEDDSFVRIIDDIRHKYEILWYYYAIIMHTWISETTGKEVFGFMLAHEDTYSFPQTRPSEGDAVMGCYISNNITGFIEYNFKEDESAIKERFNIVPYAYLKLVKNYQEEDYGGLVNEDGVLFVAHKPLGFYDEGDGFKEGVLRVQH